MYQRIKPRFKVQSPSCSGECDTLLRFIIRRSVIFSILHRRKRAAGNEIKRDNRGQDLFQTVYKRGQVKSPPGRGLQMKTEEL